jgi:hypothetical protein
MAALYAVQKVKRISPKTQRGKSCPVIYRRKIYQILPPGVFQQIIGLFIHTGFYE